MSLGARIVIILCTAIAVLGILRNFGLFELNRQATKVVNVIAEERKNKKKRKRMTKLLGMCAGVTNMFQGILMSDLTRENHIYYIERLEIRSEILNRRLTPEELRGAYAAPVFLSVLLIPVAIFVRELFILPVLCLTLFFGYQMVYRQRILDEDSIIDDYFIDLYLLLYSKLKQGSRARLQGTVENYIDTLDSQAKTNYVNVMLKLGKYMLNLLSLYEDHVAIPKLRDIYHSATIINFCNVASQALNGIDNADNLLTFKMQLVERKTNMMRARQQKILRKGERSIYAIWIILFIFVVVGWYSKLPTGFF